MSVWMRSSACDAGACVEVSWARSSFCDGGQCVEVALEWHSPSACASSGQCVEVGWHKAEASGAAGACVEVGWGKSSTSLGNTSCVEVGWEKPSASLSNGTCVEAGPGACGLVHVRDSKLGEESPVLDFTQEQWAEITESIKDGYQPPFAFLRTDDGGRDLVKDGVTLSFTDAEWVAFCDGVDNGEFDYPSSQSISSGDVVAALESEGDPEGARVVREGAGTP